MEKDKDRQGLMRYFQDTTRRCFIKRLKTTNDKEVDYSNSFLQFWLQCLSMSIFIQYFSLHEMSHWGRVISKSYGKTSRMDFGNRSGRSGSSTFQPTHRDRCQETKILLLALPQIFTKLSQFFCFSFRSVRRKASHLFPQTWASTRREQQALSARSPSSNHCTYHCPSLGSAPQRNRRLDQHHAAQTWEGHTENTSSLFSFRAFE